MAEASGKSDKIVEHATAGEEIMYATVKGHIDVIIQDFLQYIALNGKEFKHETNVLQLKFKDGKTYKFRLEVSGAEGYIRVYLENMNGILLLVACEYQILNSNNMIVHRLRWISPIHEQGLGFSKFVPIKFFEDNPQKRLANGALKVRAALTLYTYKQSIHVDKPRQYKDQFDTHGEMLIDLLDLFKAPKFSDFTLICEGRVFHVHKMFLAQRSEVFRAMLDKDFVNECINKTAQIKDCKPEILEHFLEFIYTGTLTDPTLYNSIDLILLADRYLVPDLMSKCEEALVEIIDSENAIDLLILARRIQAKDLEKRAAKFVADHLAEVQLTSAWKEMMLDDADILESVVRVLV